MTQILELFNKILHYSIKNDIEKLKASYKGNFKESRPPIHTFKITSFKYRRIFVD